jgi:two-component system sensor histidine kinase PilS (NtrC family)
MDDLRIRLYWLMSFRVAVVTLLLALALAFQTSRGEPVQTFYTLIVFTYIITIAYALSLRFMAGSRLLAPMAYVQVGVDLLLETFLVARTGGIESPFVVFYMVTVMLASLLLKGGGGLATAGLSVLLFGLVTFVRSVQLLEWSPPSRLPETETMYAFGIHSMAVMVVGLLSSALTGQLKRAGQSLVEKEQGLSRLQAFHENVVQSLSSGLFTTDAPARITSFNRAAREITKYSSRRSTTDSGGRPSTGNRPIYLKQILRHWSVRTASKAKAEGPTGVVSCLG